jgi:hypothetical protein
MPWKKKNEVEGLEELQSQMAQITNTQIKGKDNQKYRLIGAPIRNDGTGWKYIEDESHAKTGLSTISVTGNKIQVDYDFTATKVASLVVTPDETFAKNGIVVGASVGKTNALIEMSSDLSLEVTTGGVASISSFHAPDTIATNLANNEGITITHLSSSSNDKPIATIMDDGTNRSALEVRLNATTTSMTIRTFDNINGTVTNDGTNITIATNNLDIPTATFSNGVFTIAHDTSHDNSSIFAIGNDGAYVYQVIARTTSTIQVRVLDMAGAVVTVLNSNMKFNFTRFAKVKSAIPSTARIYVRRGNVQLNPNSLVNANANFWINGFMEV